MYSRAVGFKEIEDCVRYEISGEGSKGLEPPSFSSQWTTVTVSLPCIDSWLRSKEGGARFLPCRLPRRSPSLLLYGKLGGVLLGARAPHADVFIVPENRWFWTGRDWDAVGGVLVARYLRAVPDAGGVPVHTTLVISLDRYPDVCSEVGCSMNHAAQCDRLTQV